jgi:uncharacterized protein YndB with AHSA1/START domain
MSSEREFRIVSDGVLPATPDRVWEAVTTGHAGWLFALDTEMGGFGTNLVEERPHHLVTRMDGPDGWYNQIENVITEVEGGSNLHYVHSGIFVDDWEQQYDGASKHTVFYQHTLGQYLRYFDGRPVVFTDVQGPEASGGPGAFKQLLSALGVEGQPQGAQVSLDVDGIGHLEGELDYVSEYFAGIRTADAMYRFFGRNHFGSVVGLTVHDFSGHGDPDATAKEWKAYLESVYGA